MTSSVRVTERPEWHEVRFAMARAIAKRSLCVRDQVGSIIVDPNNKVIGEGHNGPPRGFVHYSRPCSQWCSRASNGQETILDCAAEEIRGLHPTYEDCSALHSEANSLLMSDRSLRAGGTIYVTSHVCLGCAKLVANSGLTCVRVESSSQHEHRRSESSYHFLVKCGITVVVNGDNWLEQFTVQA